MTQAATHLYALYGFKQAQHLVKSIRAARLTLDVTFYNEAKGSGELSFRNGILIQGHLVCLDGSRALGNRVITLLQEKDLYPLQLVGQGDDISGILNEPVPKWSDQPNSNSALFLESLDGLLCHYMGPIASIIRKQAQIDAKLAEHEPKNTTQAKKLITIITHYLSANDALLFEKEARDLLRLIPQKVTHEFVS